ncbi:MAG: ribosome maturation factor RimM [Pseudomonadota bacterium]
MSEAGKARVLIGVIAAAHGVRGLVRVKSFTAEPDGIAAYGPVTDASGKRVFRLSLAGKTKGGALLRIEGVADRNAAEALKGTKLYVDRAQLPALEGEDEFYQTDLVGLRVEGRDGRTLGHVKAVLNYGAGDVLEIGDGRTSLLLPFTKKVVPVVDIAGGRLIAEPPVEVEARP